MLGSRRKRPNRSSKGGGLGSRPVLLPGEATVLNPGRHAPSFKYTNPLGRRNEANKKRKFINAMEARDKSCFREDLDAAQEITLEPASDNFADVSQRRGIEFTREDLESRTKERDVLHNYQKKMQNRGFVRPRQRPKRYKHDAPTKVPEKQQVSTIDMDWESFEDDLMVDNDFCFISSMQQLKEAEAIEFSRWEDQARYSVPDTIENVFTQQNNMNDSLEGDSIVDLWFKSLAKIEAKINLSQQQKDFVHCCFMSLLPLIYGDQFEPNIVRLCKRFNIDAMYKKVFFQMPRRFGKTTAVSIVAALCCYVLKKKVNGEGNTIGIFSVVKSASDSITESAIGYYEMITGLNLEDFKDSWDKQKGRIVLYSYYGDKNVIWGFSAVSNVRIYFLSLSLSLLGKVCHYSMVSGKKRTP
ncbi:MAG: hypothetical protein ACTSUE_06475 [Promethearchaeota archaeon]